MLFYKKISIPTLFFDTEFVLLKNSRVFIYMKIFIINPVPNQNSPHGI
jgi:hypothetical protein